MPDGTSPAAWRKLPGRVVARSQAPGTACREAQSHVECKALSATRVCVPGIFLLVQVLPPVEALLDVCAHPDHEISDMSFAFWHKLSRQLTSSSSLAEQQQQQFPPPPGSPLAGGAQALDPMLAEQQRRREFFAPCFERLISQVRTRMR